MPLLHVIIRLKKKKGECSKYTKPKKTSISRTLVDKTPRPQTGLCSALDSEIHERYGFGKVLRGFLDDSAQCFLPVFANNDEHPVQWHFKSSIDGASKWEIRDVGVVNTSCHFCVRLQGSDGSCGGNPRRIHRRCIRRLQSSSSS